MLLLDLPQAVAASGLKVVEIDGWRTRGHGELAAVQTVVCHHTATAASAPGDYPSLGIVVNGRPDLAGPLANLGLGRSGTVYVIAAGVAYHAGETWSASQDNWHTIGIEAEHDGISPWPAELVDAYTRLCAALAAHYGLSAARVQGHKEVCKPAGRKSDPNFDMTTFRARVAARMHAQEDDVPYSDWPQADKDALAADVAKGVLDSLVGPKLTVRRALRRAGKPLPEVVAAIAKAINAGVRSAAVDGIRAGISAGQKKEQKS